MSSIVLGSVLSLFVFASLAPSPDEQAALNGLDPVELCHGNQVPGSEEFSLRHHIYRYRFSSEASLAEFQRDPARYEIQLGGGCGRMGPLSGLGDPGRFAVWDGHVYIFASDSCRQGFLEDPPSHLERDDPAPASTPETAARGAELVALAVAALGGAERLDAVQSLVFAHEERSEYQGREVLSGETWTFAFPDRVRYDWFWDTAHLTRVVAPDGGFTAHDEGVDPLHASQRALLQRDTRRFVLALLKQRGRADFLAVARGPAEVGETPVERVAVAVGGATSLLSIDPATGRVLRQQMNGRAGAGPNGTLSITYTDFRETGGIALPFAQAVSWNGRRVESLSFTWSAVKVDPVLEPETFARPAPK